MTPVRKPTPAELTNRTPLGGTPIPPKAIVPAKPKATVVAEPAAAYRARYLDEVAPVNIAGRMIKFSKDGTFITPDDEAEISEDQDFHRPVRRDDGWLVPFQRAWRVARPCHGPSLRRLQHAPA
jgi:hypothetical protein